MRRLTAMLIVAGLTLSVLPAGCSPVAPQATAVTSDLAAAAAPPTTPRPDQPEAGRPTPPPGWTAPSASEAMTLTVWTTAAISPTQVMTSGRILADQAAAFEAVHPQVKLDFVLKAPQGKGGLLDLLTTTGPVVPRLLPDLIVLDVNELRMAASTGLLRPLDDLVPPDLVADLYPFARDAGRVDGRLYGLQIQADLDHLVYDTAQVALAPRSWPGVLGAAATYVFPAGGQSGLVNDALLMQYVAVRDKAGSDADEPFLTSENLAAVLQFYRDAISSGVVPAQVGTYHSGDECWIALVAGHAALAQVSAHQYLTGRADLPSSSFASIPAVDGPAPPIARGWVLALVTDDPGRQVAAVDWMVQMLDPAVNGAWNRAAGYLPTRAAAAEEWGQDDSYDRFIARQLQLARPRPSFQNYTQVAAALQKALTAVLDGELTPRDAAAQVVNEGNLP